MIWHNLPGYYVEKMQEMYSQLAISIIQRINSCCLDQDGGSESDSKWLHYEFLLKVLCSWTREGM